MNIFESGSLVLLSTSVWEGRIKLSTHDIQVEADPDLIRASKYLVGKECLKPIKQTRQKARQYLYNKTLPFPIPGVVFIPKDLLNDVDRTLEEYQVLFYRHVKDFVRNYDMFMKAAKLKLNGLFNPMDYPKNIQSKFAFSWQFFVIDAPGQAGILSPAIYDREKERFQRSMSEFQDLAVETLRIRFAELVDHMVDRLSGEKKTFRDSMIDHITTFLADFGKLNITNDTQLAEQVERCRAIVSGVDAASLRSNEFFRANIAERMCSIQDKLDQLMINRPTRKIRFSPTEEVRDEDIVSA